MEVVISLMIHLLPDRLCVKTVDVNVNICSDNRFTWIKIIGETNLGVHKNCEKCTSKQEW